jgi:tetratricopeptide (TPR) repeat protein
MDGPDSPDTALTMHVLAGYYVQQNRHADALNLYEQALRVRRTTFPPTHPDTLWTMAGLAECHEFAGRHDEALKLREEVLGIAVPTAKQWWAYARAWLRVEMETGKISEPLSCA